MKTKMTATLAVAIVAVMVFAAAGATTYSWFSDSDETDITITTGYVGITSDLDDVNIALTGGNWEYYKQYKLTNQSTIDIVYTSNLKVTITDGSGIPTEDTLDDRVTDFKTNFKVNNVAIFNNISIDADETSYVLEATVDSWTEWEYSNNSSSMTKDETLILSYNGSNAQDLVISGKFIVEAYEFGYPYDERGVALSNGTATIDTDDLSGSNLVVSGNVDDVQGIGSSVPVSINFDKDSLNGFAAGTIVSVTDEPINNITVGDGTSVIAAINVDISGSNSQLNGNAVVTITVDGIISNPSVHHYDELTDVSTSMIIKSVNYDGGKTTIAFVTDHFSVYYVANEVSNPLVWDGSIVAPNVDGETVTINTAAELAGLAYAVNNGNSFAGYTVTLKNNINLNGIEWTPIGTSGKPFKGTFDGNGNTISNLVITGDKSNVGLFGFTTDGEIKNLTVENAKVSGRLNVGVVAGTPYTSEYTDITVKGHIEVNGMAYVGGVGGKNAYADWTNITINADETSYVNADSVENGTAYRTYVGGIIGFMGEGGHKFTNVSSNIDVTGSTCDVGGITGIAHYGNSFINCVSTGDVTLLYAGDEDDAEQIGGIAGVWNNETGYKVTFTNCTFTGKLKVNVDGVHLADNVITGDRYNNTGNGQLIIDGALGVYSVNQLQAAIDAATGVSTIRLYGDIVGNVTVTQKPDVIITIDGNGNDLAGIITVDGKSATYTTAGLIVKNVNFKADSISADACINLGDSTNATRYTCNVTVENCIFNVPNAVGIKSYTGGDKNLTILGCTATNNAHSLVQAKGIDGILVEDCTVNSKNGLNFNNSTNVTVVNCVVDVSGYAVRFGEGSAGNEHSYNYSVQNCALKSANDDGDATIILRGTANNSTLTLENTTIEGTVKFTNSANATVIIDGIVYVNDLKGAIDDGKDIIFLLDGEYTLPSITNKDVTISGTKDVVITVDKPNCSGSDLIFSGITVKGSGYSTGVQHVNTVTYNEVTIIGEMCLYGEEVVFNSCTFKLNNQYVWTYGAKEVEFNNCIFNTNGKAILIYNEGAGANKVTVKSCVFNATAGAKAGAIANQNCAAIEIDNFQSSGTGAAHILIAEGNTYNDNFSGEWRIKNFVTGNAVTVNGTEYTQIAIDGKLMTIDSGKNVTVSS